MEDLKCTVKFEFELCPDLANEFMQFIQGALLQRQIYNYNRCLKDNRRDIFMDVDKNLVMVWNQILEEIKYTHIDYVDEDGTPVAAQRRMSESFKMQEMPADEIGQQ